MGSNDVFVSREELYSMVWSTPMQKLAKEFGISDVALAKACKKLGVPRPPRGFWARKAAGQHVKTAPLPKKEAKQRDGVYFSRPQEPKEPIQLSAGTINLIEQLTLPENILSVGDSLEKPHPLTRRTKQTLSKSKPNMYGVLWRNSGCLDFRVSKGSLKRALLMMDVLLKQLEQIGFEVAISDRGETLVSKGDVQMKIGLYERSSRLEHILDEKQKVNAWLYDKYRYEPSGEFDFTLSRWPLHDRHWRDTAKRKLENRLTDIIVEIVCSTELVKLEQDRRESERLERLEEQRLEAERVQRKIEEERRWEELENQASLWRRANDLRTFISACKSELSSDRSAFTEASIANWLFWAKQHADSIDPIKNGYFSKALASDKDVKAITG